MTHMIVRTANAERLAEDALAAVWNPPPAIDYLAWAEDNIEFSKRESPFPGAYNRDLFPYFDEILRALGPDDPCRIVTLSKSAQLGGTVLANIYVGGSIDMDPSDILYVHPTENNAERWSKMKLSPMLKGTPALSRIFPMKTRDGQDSVRYKERIDGRGAILISGANSPASLSQVTMQRQVQDDLAKWEMNAAGDPETQADSRSRAHEFAKIFKISTPLVEPGCRITKSYEAGSQEQFQVPCPQCDAYQVLEWENLLSSINENEPEGAHFTCVECGFPIEEHHRSVMLPRGKWVAANPKAKREHRSFHLWSAYSFLQSFERIVREWLAAKGDPASEKTFSNDTIGRAYKTLGEAPPWEALRDRGAVSSYPRGLVPKGALVLTIGVDCQSDRVEWQLVGWGRERQRFIIEAGVIPGHISSETCQDRLNALLSQQWTNFVGRKVPCELLAIDGNAWTEDVWSWAKKHPASRVIMVRGVPSETAPLIQRVRREHNRAGKLVKYSKRFFHFATSVLKMGLYRSLALTDPLARSFVGLPLGLEDEFYRQLTAETRKAEKNRRGFIEWRWVKDPSQANEMLDTHLQAEAAALKLGLRDLPEGIWDRYETERETPEPEAQLDFEDGLFAPQPVPGTTEPSDDQPIVAAPKPAPRRTNWGAYRS